VGVGFLWLFLFVPGSFSADWTASLTGDTETVEQQSKLTCQGSAQDSTRAKLAEELMKSDGFALQLLERLRRSAFTANQMLNQAEEKVIMSARAAKAEVEKSRLEAVVYRLEHERNRKRKEQFRDEVRAANASYQKFKEPSPLSDEEVAKVREFRSKWMAHLEKTLKLSDRVSGALSQALGCHGKSTLSQCYSLEELQSKTEQFKAAKAYQDAKDAFSKPSNLQSSMVR